MVVSKTGTGPYVWSLANGADVITDAVKNDAINLAELSYMASQGDQQYTTVQGTYSPQDATFTSGSGVDTLVLYDGTSGTGISTTAIVLQNVATLTQTNNGQIII